MEVHPQYAQTSAQELSTVSTVFSTATSGEKDPDFRGSARSNAFFHTDCGKNFAPPVVNITIFSIPVDNFLPIHKGRINSLPQMCRGCRPCELRLPACRGSCQSEGLTQPVKEPLLSNNESRGFLTALEIINEYKPGNGVFPTPICQLF